MSGRGTGTGTGRREGWRWMGRLLPIWFRAQAFEFPPSSLVPSSPLVASPSELQVSAFKPDAFDPETQSLSNRDSMPFALLSSCSRVPPPLPSPSTQGFLTDSLYQYTTRPLATYMQSWTHTYIPTFLSFLSFLRPLQLIHTIVSLHLLLFPSPYTPHLYMYASDPSFRYCHCTYHTIHTKSILFLTTFYILPLCTFVPLRRILRPPSILSHRSQQEHDPIRYDTHICLPHL
ncbi:hypothetical protein C8R43DRAFT_1029247 [Mycena crocata]|nr:hypothetical protein C8R43DRAFT_1029247 [Mycena crocata]